MQCKFVTVRKVRVKNLEKVLRKRQITDMAVGSHLIPPQTSLPNCMKINSIFVLLHQNGSCLL